MRRTFALAQNLQVWFHKRRFRKGRMDTTFLQQAFSDSQVLTVPWSIDYFSVVVGVLTGALFACDRKLDIIGTVVLGLVTGYGGGIIRDMLLQTHGVYFTSHPDLILICIAICAFVFYFRGLFRHLDATVFFADALSVGLFALAGASKAFSLEQGFVLSVILGAITAVGGGAVRDICVGETPGNFPAVELLRGGRPRRIVRVRGPGLCGKPVAACGCGLRVRRRVPALLERVLRLEDQQRGRPQPLMWRAAWARCGASCPVCSCTAAMPPWRRRSVAAAAAGAATTASATEDGAFAVVATDRAGLFECCNRNRGKYVAGSR